MQTTLFQPNTGLALRLLLLGVLSVAVMTYDHRFDHLQTARAHLSLVIYPIRVLVDMPVRVGSWVVNTAKTHITLLAENDQLRTEHQLMQAQLQRMAALQTENNRLRKLLGASSKVVNTVLVAELLAVDLDPYRQQVVIDKGKDHGIYTGQPVIDASGVMGQIVQADNYTSTALLISDASHALPVQINRTGLRTIASGTGSPDRLNLLFIPSTADIRIGDEVYTSGLGGRFPVDYPVATIRSVERPPGKAFAEVIATPSARLDRSREVLLVWHESQPPATTDDSE